MFLIPMFLSPIPLKLTMGSQSPGGVLRISSDGADRMGEKKNPKKSLGLLTKPQKIPGPKINAQKIPCRTRWPGYAGTTTNLQIVLNTQKNPYLNQATQKNTCQIFLSKKIPAGIEKFKPKKILRSSPSLEIRSTTGFFLQMVSTLAVINHTKILRHISRHRP